MVSELQKQAPYAAASCEMCHFRSHAGPEVDIVLEGPGGEIVGIEVKASATVNPSDGAGIAALADAAGKRFVRGVVLYTGRHVLPLGDRVQAWPVSTLWGG